MSETEPVDLIEPVETEQKPVTDKKPVKEVKIRDTTDAILELRRENEKLRKTLDEQSASKAEELSNQKLEELRASTEETATKNAEKMMEKRLTEIEEAAKARLVKAELKGAALKANVIDFDDVYEILKRNGLKSVEYDEDGNVTNAADIIGQLKDKKGHLFAGISTASTERTPVSRDHPVETKTALGLNKVDYEIAKARLARM